MFFINRIIKLKSTPTRLVLLMSVFLLLTANWTFFGKLTDVYPWNSENALFLLSMGIFLSSVLVLITTFFYLVLPVRIVVSLFILLAAVAGYFADQMGVVIDKDMIRNILETNISEATDLMNLGLILRVLLLGVLPVILIWRWPLQKSGWLHETRYTLQTAAGSIVVILATVLLCSDYYASFFREHKSLRYYINPTLSIYSMVKYVKEATKSSGPIQFALLTSKAETPTNDNHSELIILVVGETARADHFSLNGYRRETNPELAKETALISFSNISACGTSTAISVPCMFSQAGHDSFDVELARHTENILDILNKAKVNVLWRDNNSSSKGMANRVTFEDYRSPDINPICDPECRDTGMLDGLQNYIDTHEGDILIVLHQMGSHGPAYYKRYPGKFERFKPACHTLELSACTDEEVINAYDNSILYTDYFLSKVIELLKKNTPQYETAMLYVSDHGESLGESGLYLHGMPYMIAPEAQIKVPVITWVGESSDIDYQKTLSLKDTPNSHDALFSTLLDSFETQTDLTYHDYPPLVYFKDKDHDDD